MKREKIIIPHETVENENKNEKSRKIWIEMFIKKKQNWSVDTFHQDALFSASVRSPPSDEFPVVAHSCELPLAASWSSSSSHPFDDALPLRFFCLGSDLLDLQLFLKACIGLFQVVSSQRIFSRQEASILFLQIISLELERSHLLFFLLQIGLHLPHLFLRADYLLLRCSIF